MERYQQSDENAARMLIDALSPQVFQFFLAQVRDRSYAEDLLQDFWVRVHRARHTFQRGRPLRPWAFAIARRVRVDQYRRLRTIRQHELQTDQLPECNSPEPASALPDLSQLLERLPPAQRETVLLLKVSGLSLEEVARATGSSIGAVKQKAHRAYENLRKHFGGAV